MNILVIGNGFDIAHGLPTSYQQFLRFVSEEGEMSSRLQKNGLSPMESAVAADDIKNLSSNNYWMDHFKEISNCGENWIDFESEISKVIQRIDEVRKIINSARSNPYSQLESDCFVEIQNRYSDIYDEFEFEEKIDDPELISRIKNKLLKDLNRLIRCLEIYLCQYVNLIDVSDKKLELFNSIRFDDVLSFNYMNTFERFYGSDNTKYHYIHGKADIDHSVENCNMILGIDEYLRGEEKDRDNEFIEFKKFFQRIYKGTGAEYKSWVHRIEDLLEHAPKMHYEPDEIYILGHSLDVTDKDVLRELLMNPYTRVHIIYHNQKALADKIANLVKVIGQDKLVEYTYAKKPKIDFVLQR